MLKQIEELWVVYFQKNIRLFHVLVMKLFVDVLVVVSDVLAVGDVLTLGCYAVFNEPVRQLLQGRDGTAHARRKASCSKSRQQCPGCLTCGSYLI